VGLPTGIACDQGKIAFQATVAGLNLAYLSRRALWSDLPNLRRLA